MDRQRIAQNCARIAPELRGSARRQPLCLLPLVIVAEVVLVGGHAGAEHLVAPHLADLDHLPRAAGEQRADAALDRRRHHRHAAQPRAERLERRADRERARRVALVARDERRHRRVADGRRTARWRRLGTRTAARLDRRALRR